MAKAKRLVLWGVLALVVIAAAACGDDITIRYPSAPVELFRRVNQFLTIAALLISEGRSLWGQGISNAYYAALTLARFKHTYFYADAAEQFHQQVWSQAPKQARKYFRDELRRLRIKYDYEFDWPSDEGPADDLRDFTSKAPPAFDALIVDTEKILERRYRGCSELHNEAREECLVCNKQLCERQLMFAELTSMRAKLTELFTVRVPKALAGPGEPSTQSDDRGVSSA